MDLTCYVYSGWKPRLRAASPRREWMDNAPEQFAYRCLPLNIANAHGWEFLSPCGFTAVWNGGMRPEDVMITVDAGTADQDRPAAIFGQAVLTFHVPALVRTEPGWNLWVGGSPNYAKDGIAPLTGVVETDWSPFTFTMNWRFTRPNHPVRFEENDPFAFVFPVKRGPVETVTPQFLPIEDQPELKDQFEAWSKSRDAFQKRMVEDPPALPADKWQKLYYRGVDAYGQPGAADHQSKLRAPDFTGAPAIPETPPPLAQPAAKPDLPLLKRQWVLETQEALRALSPARGQLFRRENLDGEEFLDDHYALNLPVVLAGVASHWASAGWTPESLAARIGTAAVQVSGGRDSDAAYERRKDEHLHELPFADFIRQIADTGGNDLYLTAYNASSNEVALASLYEDLGEVPEILQSGTKGMLWIGPGGTFTPLHHDLTNNLLIQLVGRKRIILAPASASAKLYNDAHVFSRVMDLAEPDLAAFPDLAGLRLHDLILEPGDALFIPVGWWHQVRALDFSVSLTRTDFVWPNQAWEHYPSE